MLIQQAEIREEKASIGYNGCVGLDRRHFIHGVNLQREILRPCTYRETRRISITAILLTILTCLSTEGAKLMS